MWTCWDCDLQGPKGGIWAGEWVGLGPFGALSGLQHSWVHFGPFQGGQAGLGTYVVSQNLARRAVSGPILVIPAAWGRARDPPR